MKHLFIAIMFVCLAVPAYAQEQFPSVTGRIVDEAHVLSPPVITSLEQTLANFEQKTSDRIVVVTVLSLHGLSIEDYAYQVAQHWHIGEKDKNNGVLLIVAPKERKVRIEVGYALTPILTDSASTEIVQDTLLPAFRQNHMEQGIIDGIQAIIFTLNNKDETHLSPASAPPITQESSASEPTNWPNVIIGISIIIILLFIYLLPSIVAQKRNHHNLLAIFITNLFLGWTFLGWVASLIWACTQVKS